LILKDKARQFNEDSEIQFLLAEIRSTTPEFAVPLGVIAEPIADRVKTLGLDRAELAAKKLPYERLDQLTVDILFGVR